MSNLSRLRNVARWHIHRGCALVGQSAHVENNAEYESILRSAGHHMTVHDDIQRDIFLLEHRKTK